MQLEVDEEGGVAGVELSGGIAVLGVVLHEDGGTIIKDKRGGPARGRGRSERPWQRRAEDREESRSTARWLQVDSRNTRIGRAQSCCMYPPAVSSGDDTSVECGWNLVGTDDE